MPKTNELWEFRREAIRGGNGKQSCESEREFRRLFAASRATFRAVEYRDEWLVNPRVHFADTNYDDDDCAVDDNKNKEQPFNVPDTAFTVFLWRYDLFNLLTSLVCVVNE